MKKRISSVIALALCLVMLCACGQVPAVPTAQPEATPAPAAAPTPAFDVKMLEGVYVEEIAARAALYRGQLTAYAAALSRILGQPVKECVLFFLSAGRTVKLEMKE